MRNKRKKKGILLIICMIIALTAGCTKGESETVKAGVKIMKDYLDDRGNGGYVSERNAVILRTDEATLYLTDYMDGS